MVAPGCLAGRGVFSALSAAGDWVKKGSCHTAWSVPLFLRVLAHIRMDEAQLPGHKLGSGAGHCLLGCGGLWHP